MFFIGVYFCLDFVAVIVTGTHIPLLYMKVDFKTTKQGPLVRPFLEAWLKSTFIVTQQYLPKIPVRIFSTSG